MGRHPARSRPAAGKIELEQDGESFLLRTRTIGVTGKLLQAVGVALPPNVQELPLPASKSPA
jgi:hypothetical protein